MRNFLWRDGRLSWPLVIGMLLLTLTLVLFDLAWRLITIDFAKLALAGLLFMGLVVFVAAVVFPALRRSEAPAKSCTRRVLQ